MLTYPCRLWDVLETGEVNQVCTRTVDPSMAARRLLTLAQTYGSTQSISVMVISLVSPQSSSLNRHPASHSRAQDQGIHQTVARNGEIRHPVSANKEFRRQSVSENGEVRRTMNRNEKIRQFAAKNEEVRDRAISQEDEEPRRKPVSQRKSNFESKRMSSRRLKEEEKSEPPTSRLRASVSSTELRENNKESEHQGKRTIFGFDSTSLLRRSKKFDDNLRSGKESLDSSNFKISMEEEKSRKNTSRSIISGSLVDVDKTSQIFADDSLRNSDVRSSKRGGSSSRSIANDIEVSKKNLFRSSRKRDGHRSKENSRQFDPPAKPQRMMSMPCLNFSDPSAELIEDVTMFPLDRSSPSGQSFSDLSLLQADEVYDVKAPVWPGQLGPVAPSGPFAMDLSRGDGFSVEAAPAGHLAMDPTRSDGFSVEVAPPRQFAMDLTRGDGFSVDQFEDVPSQFRRRSSVDEGPGFKRDRFSMRSSADSHLSNSSKTTHTGLESLRSSQRSILKKSNVPVFRPYYHFPSPDSLIHLNKSNSGRYSPTSIGKIVNKSSSGRYSPTLPHAFASRSHLGRSSGRSSVTSRKESGRQSVVSKGSSHSSSLGGGLSGALSDSDHSDLSSASRLCNNLYTPDARQVMSYL